jgi:hypothetical protein
MPPRAVLGPARACRRPASPGIACDYGCMSRPFELTPSQRLLLQVASPRAANFVQWWEGRQRLKHERYLSFVEIVEAGNADSLEALLNRANADDDLSDFTEAVIEHVLRESSRVKVEAFGRLLSLMSTTVDDARVDEAWLLLRAAAELDPPHLKILRAYVRTATAITESTTTGSPRCSSAAPWCSIRC